LRAFKLKLSTKFVLFSIITFSVAFASITIYFYIYINEQEAFKAKSNTVKLFKNIAQDIQKIQDNLIQQTYFLDNEESMLASIYFINTYEHSKDYEKALIDEEKKSVVDSLHQRARFAFNDALLLYVQDQSIAVGVERTNGDYKKFYSSYAQNKRHYYSTSNRQKEYALDNTVERKYNTIHQEFYSDSPHAKPQITFHLKDNTITISAHHSIFEENQSIAHIEISKRFDTQSLKAYPTYNTLRLSRDKSLQSIATDIKHLENTNIIKQNQNYLSALKIATLDGDIYIQFTQSRIDLIRLIKSGSNSFLTMLSIIALIFILVMYAFYHLALITPLAKLMENIQHIKNREFSHLQELKCNDELEEIAHNIDHLAHNVQTKEKELQDIAEHDSLTGLYNRYHFNNIINEKIKNIQKGSSLALIFIDVDEFKSINDTLGHDTGDKLLISIAKRLKDLVSPRGYLSRIGGDEFMIILPNIDTLDRLYDFAHQLQHLFTEPFTINHHYMQVTISSGIVLAHDHTTTLTTLYQEADIALYKSKERGKARFTIYQEEFAIEIKQRNKLLHALQSALANPSDEFHLCYQPKISTLDTQTINGIEALIRWENKALGTIPPDKFIPIAEKSGMIIELGYWIIEQACQDFLALQKENIHLKQISINISSIQFSTHGFLDHVKSLIKRIGIDPSHIEFELTERIIANDDSSILFALNAFKSLGIHIAIDDFGTGYSSLSYLHQLPVDRLKIDKSFVSDINNNDAIEIIEKAILPLAKALHLATTAEGVESYEEFETLKRIGVDDIQGYYFSKPLKLAELKSFAKKRNS